jgi:hypothetical protein
VRLIVPCMLFVAAGCQALPGLRGPADATGATRPQGQRAAASNGSGHVPVVDAGGGGAGAHGAVRRPGAGILIGRVIDGVTGLPVPDAGASLLGLEQRTLTGPDGRFRFDGVPAGALTLILGPADGYVAASRAIDLDAEGPDAGLVTLLPLT